MAGSLPSKTRDYCQRWRADIFSLRAPSREGHNVGASRGLPIINTSVPREKHRSLERGKQAALSKAPAEGESACPVPLPTPKFRDLKNAMSQSADFGWKSCLPEACQRLQNEFEERSGVRLRMPRLPDESIAYFFSTDPFF